MGGGCLLTSVDNFYIYFVNLQFEKKFIYSEKAAKFCEISTVDLSYVGDFAKFCGLLSIYEGVEILFSYRTSVSKINGHKFYLKLYCKIWDYFWGKRRFYYLKIREVISSNKSAIQLNSSHPLASLLPVTFWSDEPKYLHCLWVLIIESLLLMLNQLGSFNLSTNYNLAKQTIWLQNRNHTARDRQTRDQYS